MLTGRDDISKGLRSNKVKFSVMGVNEVTSDIPEHSDLNTVWPTTDWDAYRGLGATQARPAVSGAEENILCLDGDVYAGENIMVHEFAHTFSGTDLDNPPTFKWDVANGGTGGDLLTEIESSYARQVTTNGLWSNTYAGKFLFIIGGY